MRTVGLDIAESAVAFGRVLKDEFLAASSLCVGDFMTLPFADRTFDVSYSLGALEHRSPGEQSLLLSELTRVTRSYVVLLVPNPESPIFKAMEELEMTRMPPALVYPEERRHYAVNFGRLARQNTLEIAEASAIHIVPPLIIPAIHMTEGAAQFFSRITQEALSNWTGSAMTTWLSVEERTAHELKSQYGWFSYAVFRKPGSSCNTV